MCSRNSVLFHRRHQFIIVSNHHLAAALKEGQRLDFIQTISMQGLMLTTLPIPKARRNSVSSSKVKYHHSCPRVCFAYTVSYVKWLRVANQCSTPYRYLPLQQAAAHARRFLQIVGVSAHPTRVLHMAFRHNFRSNHLKPGTGTGDRMSACRLFFSVRK